MVISDLAQVASALDGAVKIGGLLGDATNYHLASGGTAWHARLDIACSESVGVRHDDRIALAEACELVHQASVAHDDVQDEASLRRGRQSATAKSGAPAVLCVGDHLLVSAFAQLDSLLCNPDLIRLFAAGIF